MVAAYLCADRGEIRRLHLFEHLRRHLLVPHRGAVRKAEQAVRGGESDDVIPVQRVRQRLIRQHVADDADEFKIDLSFFHTTPF